MSLTWQPEEPMTLPRIGPAGRLRAGLRGAPFLLLLGGGLLLLLAVRVAERPCHGERRPWSPWVTVGVCRASLRLIGLGSIVEGRPIGGVGAILANHSSWLDILVLNAQRPVVFVSKAEVAGWPGIGWLARATGTLFVQREARRQSVVQVELLRRRIERGEGVVLFPEGTSSDGRRVLPFKPALLAGVPPGSSVQPVTLSWRSPHGEDPRFYAWCGGMAFGPHALSVLAARRQGTVILSWHDPIPARDLDRKAMARAAEEAVRAALR